MEAAGPQPGAEEIDMSLDDIIKRHREEQTEPSSTGDRPQVKDRNAGSGYRRPQFRSWTQRNWQGPNHFRRGFGQQQYNRRQFRNTVPGPRRRAVAALNRVSPLNCQASSVQEGKRNEDAFPKSSGQTKGRQRPPPGPKRFRAAAASTHAPGRRPFRLNRGPALQQKRMPQRFSKANFRRGQMGANGAGKPPRMRRWHMEPSPGAVLTVSVANPQAGTPGPKQPFLRSRRPPPLPAKPQPKGVLLRFNFRAMANQTSLTLDERFSGLRKKKRFAAARSTGRTVTMP